MEKQLQWPSAVGRRAGAARRVWTLGVLATAGVIGLTPGPIAGHGAEHGPVDSPPDTTRTTGLPLKPTRVARFRVTEGTWISLDVSPNGQTIVFDLLGDLYTLPITGGKARRLTSGMAFRSQPRYSPDGRHLVFVSDQSGSANLWVADADGCHARQLSRLHGHMFGAVTSPAWSPDGRTIVVAQKLGATRPGFVGVTRLYRWLIAAYDVETRQMRWIGDTVPDRARSALGPAFGPGGDVVYAAVGPLRAAFWIETRDWRIARVNVATGRIQPEMGLLAGRVGMRPAVSRDGRYLVYATSSGSHLGLRLRDLRTDRERWLVREALDDPPFSAEGDTRDLVPGYAFTPDSKSLVAAYGGKIHRIQLATGRSVVIPFVAEVARELGPLTVHQFALPDTAVHTRSVLQPALSPDGTWVAFSALDRLWIMELPHDGHSVGQPYRATADSAFGEFYPSWSPDGHSIVYSTWRDGEGGAVRWVRVMHEALARPPPSERLTRDTALYFHTAVAPDGNRVVALRAALPPERVLTGKDSLTPALVWVPATGGMPRTVTSLPVDYSLWFRDRHPVAQVYFTTDASRVYVGLTSWRWDGTDRRTTPEVVGPEDSWEPYKASGVLSPDARRALITRKDALFEVGLQPAQPTEPGTLDLQRAQTEPFGAAAGAAHRWGTALGPWISWSHNGRRVLFGQGGTLFLGEVQADGWTSFARVDVPLMVPVDEPHGTVVLHGARLITMRGSEVIEHGDLVVRGNRIIAVGPVGRISVPEGARVFDLTGTTILPGYLDLHDHMRLPRAGVHPQQCWQCLAQFAYGVTAARDPQPDFAVDVFAYRERERTGDLLGPRVFSTGMAYFGTDPPIQTLADARDAVRPNAEYFDSETYKVYVDPSVGRRAWQLLAMALAEARLNATVHTFGVELALKTAMDGFPGLEHAPQNRLYADVVGLIARSGATHTQTYGPAVFGAWYYGVRRHGDPWERAKMRRFAPPAVRALICDWCLNDERIGPPELDNLVPLVSGAARIAAEGGQVGMGSHGDIPGLGYHYEMWLHSLGGMPNHEILRSATIVGATAIGHLKDLGSLEVGKLADLQVLDDNPLEDIHNTTNIRYVMKNGRLYEADDLTAIWPRHKPLASIYLWEPSSEP